MRSYVGIALDTATFQERPDELQSLELEGFREVDLGDSKVTLMLLKWAPDESTETSLLASLIAATEKGEQSD